jgi:DnaK suppressor protein
LSCTDEGFALSGIKSRSCGSPKNVCDATLVENTMNVETTHLATLRSLLTHRLRDLGAEVRADEIARRAPAAREVMDQKDEASRSMQDDVLEAQERRDVDEMWHVRSALERLDAGTYGDCEVCHEPIALQRLLVEPAALRCVSCQSAFERAGVISGR